MHQRVDGAKAVAHLGQAVEIGHIYLCGLQSFDGCGGCGPAQPCHAPPVGQQARGNGAADA
ncbi:hypothetical protein MAFF211479_48590 (plasmid) [Ralstonia solanacearum]|nr:hypothetical protein MAFF211479_48590 [Ralstonia solanacearum]BCM00261.1 hypothetical protein MAFF211491_47140 [Ralstonia solanacearum]BCM15757.1 hypothetical protein MAFF241648_49470 [Ralstonia solanacearum]BCN07724.1 hypothetical protein RPSB_48610 [Ralstonia solanacearum]BCN12872.1 hypothetical protein RPSD_47570 [Ralstonia solanacearum]